MDDNSNSSGDSGNGYHGEEEPRHQPAIPVHRNESISLSDMEKYSTDVEVREGGGDRVCGPCTPHWKVL